LSIAQISAALTRARRRDTAVKAAAIQAVLRAEDLRRHGITSSSTPTTASKPTTAASNTASDQCAAYAATGPRPSSSLGSRSCRTCAVATTSSRSKQPELSRSPPRLPNSRKRSDPVLDPRPHCVHRSVNATAPKRDVASPARWRGCRLPQAARRSAGSDRSRMVAARRRRRGTGTARCR
jgi:hypothetical protein